MKREISWNEYLYALPPEDYAVDRDSLDMKLSKAASFIKEADSVLIGAGAGLSSAAGLTYSGERFQKLFPDFIEKYGLEDMYSSSFYPFRTEEEKWAYWSRHVTVNRIDPPALPVYEELRKLAGDNSFVLTTNVDHQFYKAGFPSGRIFATQGDYGLIQCAHACHEKTYDDVKLFQQMEQAVKDCRVPKYMVPKCPVCGGPMEINIRKDQYFVEDDDWHRATEAYAGFIEENRGRKVVMLELGVGFNTPMIIRFPFDHMLKKLENWTLVRLNLNQAFIPESLHEKAVGIDGDIATTLAELAGRCL